MKYTKSIYIVSECNDKEHMSEIVDRMTREFTKYTSQAVGKVLVWSHWRDNMVADEIFSELDKAMELSKYHTRTAKGRTFPESYLWEASDETIVIFSTVDAYRTLVTDFICAEYKSDIECGNAFVFKLEAVLNVEENKLRVVPIGFLYNSLEDA